MKRLFLLPLFISLCAHAGDREKQFDLELKSKKGIEIEIGYSSEITSGFTTFGIDVHIEEITIHANGLNGSKNVKVFLNGQLVTVPCEGQVCHRKATKEDGLQSLYSQNVYFLGYRSQPTTKPIFASFQLNDDFWLVDPVRQDTYFQLMVKNRP